MFFQAKPPLKPPVPEVGIVAGNLQAAEHRAYTEVWKLELTVRAVHHEDVERRHVIVRTCCVNVDDRPIGKPMLLAHRPDVGLVPPCVNREVVGGETHSDHARYAIEPKGWCTVATPFEHELDHAASGVAETLAGGANFWEIELKALASKSSGCEQRQRVVRLLARGREHDVINAEDHRVSLSTVSRNDSSAVASAFNLVACAARPRLWYSV